MTIDLFKVQREFLSDDCRFQTEFDKNLNKKCHASSYLTEQHQEMRVCGKDENELVRISAKVMRYFLKVNLSVRAVFHSIFPSLKSILTLKINLRRFVTPRTQLSQLCKAFNENTNVL